MGSIKEKFMVTPPFRQIAVRLAAEQYIPVYILYSPGAYFVTMKRKDEI
jgi:hypothetical protein